MDFGFLSEIVTGSMRALPEMTTTGLQGTLVANAQLEVPKLVKTGRGKGARYSNTTTMGKFDISIHSWVEAESGVWTLEGLSLPVPQNKVG
jgi:hypothetical protein